jgi:hypothetical protein
MESGAHPLHSIINNQGVVSVSVHTMAALFGCCAACFTYATTAQAEGLHGFRDVGARKHHYLPATKDTVHWGFLSKHLPGIVEAESGDFVTIEAVTHHAHDDFDRMIKGDAGVEGIFRWDTQGKGVDRRGAVPMDASLFGRGAGEGLGVHIMTGPVHATMYYPVAVNGGLLSVGDPHASQGDSELFGTDARRRLLVSMQDPLRSNGANKA